MRNSYAQQLAAARNKGVDYGLKGMAMIATISLNNVLLNHVTDEEKKKILTEFDAEVYRVWQEYKQEAINKNEDIGTLIVGWYERILGGNG